MKYMKKLIALVLCVLMLVSATSCTAIVVTVLDKITDVHKPSGEPTDSEIGVGTNNSVDIPNISETDVFDGIIEQYCALVKMKDKGAPLSADERGEFAEVIRSVVEACANPKIMGYAIKDINRDGNRELFLMENNCRIHAIFTEYEGRAKHIVTIDTMGSAVLGTYGEIYSYHPGDEKRMALYRVGEIKDGEYDYFEFGYEYPEGSDEAVKIYIEDGVKTELTYEMSLNYNNIYAGYLAANGSEYTKAKGLYFVSALDTEPSNAPYLGFSTYEEIIDSFKKITELYAEFSKLDWLYYAKYDGIYRFASEEDYVIYNALLGNGSAYGRYLSALGHDVKDKVHTAFGYCMLDMNGDGVDELVLLQDNYEILAIFTMRDGRPVFLNEQIDGAITHVDSNGRIYTDAWNGSGYPAGYEFNVYEICDGTVRRVLGFSVGAEMRGNDYRTVHYRLDDDRNKTEIDAEEYAQCEDEYNIIPKFMSTYEYVYNFTSIHFTPLYEVTYDEADYVGEYKLYLGMNKTKLTVAPTAEEGVLSLTLDYVLPMDTNGDGEYREEELYSAQYSLTAYKRANGVYAVRGAVDGDIYLGLENMWFLMENTEDENIAGRYYYFKIER